MTTLENKDSRSTLVEEAERTRVQNNTPHPLPPSPLTPASPFSASFDPNGPLPLTPEFPNAPIIPARSLHRPVPEAWGRTVSASLSTLATQFAAASQALATLPQTAILDTDDDSTASSSAAVVSIQQAQARLEEELDSLREQITALGEHRRAEKEKAREGAMITDEDVRDHMETRFLGIERKLDDLAETIRLDQARLYSRLHNSTITNNKQTLFALPMATGKTPPNFPATKGEFEHLTKERYEALLKGYGVPLQGDTNAKRQTLREFIGLSPPSAK